MESNLGQQHWYIIMNTTRKQKNKITCDTQEWIYKNRNKSRIHVFETKQQHNQQKEAMFNPSAQYKQKQLQW